MNNGKLMDIAMRWKTASTQEIFDVKTYIGQTFSINCKNGGMAVICYSTLIDIISYDSPSTTMLTITRPEGIKVVCGSIDASDWINVQPEGLQDYLIDMYSISSEPCMFCIRNGFDEIEIIGRNWNDDIITHIIIDKDTGIALREI